MTIPRPFTRIVRPFLTVLLLSAPVPQAWAVTYDPIAATPWVQAKVEGSIPTVEQIGTSAASASSSSGNGSASASLDAAKGSMTVLSQANFDWNAAGARTVVEWDYFTIHGITAPVEITAHFGINGKIFADAKTKSARLDTALEYESEYSSGGKRNEWSVCDGCTMESGLIPINEDVTQSFQVSDIYPYFRLRTWLIGDVYHADTYVHATGQLSFDLPAGAWVTSKAGFLAPVPEAETWAMLLAGLGLVGWATRRSRRQ